jgi:hypothetical protein
VVRWYVWESYRSQEMITYVTDSLIRIEQVLILSLLDIVQ